MSRTHPHLQTPPPSSVIKVVITTSRADNTRCLCLPSVGEISVSVATSWLGARQGKRRNEAKKRERGQAESVVGSERSQTVEVGNKSEERRLKTLRLCYSNAHARLCAHSYSLSPCLRPNEPMQHLRMTEKWKSSLGKRIGTLIFIERRLQKTRKYCFRNTAQAANRLDFQPLRKHASWCIKRNRKRHCSPPPPPLSDRR